jgi:hypothetical protein
VTDSRPVFEIRRQEVPVSGWVVVARWPMGKEEQLVGVFTKAMFAESWIVEQSENWLAQQVSRPEE